MKKWGFYSHLQQWAAPVCQRGDHCVRPLLNFWPQIIRIIEHSSRIAIQRLIWYMNMDIHRHVVSWHNEHITFFCVCVCPFFRWKYNCCRSMTTHIIVTHSKTHLEMSGRNHTTQSNCTRWVTEFLLLYITYITLWLVFENQWDDIHNWYICVLFFFFKNLIVH